MKSITSMWIFFPLLEAGFGLNCSDVIEYIFIAYTLFNPLNIFTHATISKA